MSETPVAAYRRVGSEVSRYQETPQERSGVVHKVEKGSGDNHRVDTYRSESSAQPAVTETYRRAPNGSLVKTYEKQHPNGVHEASCLTLDKTSSNKVTVYTRPGGRITTVTEAVRPDGSRSTTKQDGNGKSVTVNYDANGKRIPETASPAPTQPGTTPQVPSTTAPSSPGAPRPTGGVTPTTTPPVENNGTPTQVPTTTPPVESNGTPTQVPTTTSPTTTPPVESNSTPTQVPTTTPRVENSGTPSQTPPSGTTPTSTPPAPRSLEEDRKIFHEYFQDHQTQGNEAAYRASLKTLAAQGNSYAAQRLRGLQTRDMGFNTSEARDHENLAALNGRMADDTKIWALASAAVLTGTWAVGGAASTTAVVATGGATVGAGGATAVGAAGSGALTSTLAATTAGGATTALATTGGAATTALATTGGAATTALATTGGAATTALATTGGAATSSLVTAGGAATTALGTTGSASTAALTGAGGAAASAADLTVASTLQQLVNLRAAGDMVGAPLLMPALRLSGSASLRSLIL